MKINYLYQITEADYIDYYQMLIYEIRGNKIFNKLTLLLIICFISFLYSLINPTKTLIIILIIIGSFILLVLLLTPLITEILAKKAYKRNPYIKELNEYIINDSYIHISTGNNQAIVDWKHLVNYYESKKNIYCLFAYNHVLIIPKNLVEVDKIISFIKSKVI